MMFSKGRILTTLVAKAGFNVKWLNSTPVFKSFRLLHQTTGSQLPGILNSSLCNNNANEIKDPTYSSRVQNPVNSNLIQSVYPPFVYDSKITISAPSYDFKIIVDPSKIIEKQAARLIVIRRRKMKRHKLKKLRVKMKFEWAKVRQRREMRKEKAFQAELMGKIREAESFNASAYAAEKINKANEVLIPKLWKGKRLPEFVIKDLLEKERKKKVEQQEALKRRKSISVNVTDYKV